MTDLIKLKLENVRHKNRALWITPTGDLLYGSDEENLIYPDGLEMTGDFPPICLSDLKRAFLLGKERGVKAD